MTQLWNTFEVQKKKRREKIENSDIRLPSLVRLIYFFSFIHCYMLHVHVCV